MDFSWPTLLIALVLGVIQLAAGLVIGRLLVLRSPAYNRSQTSGARRLRQFAGRLFEVVSSVADDVDQCQNQIEEINRELASVEEQDDPLTQFVLDLVARILQINQRLQERLSTAEEKLAEQTRLIETQLAEARTDVLTGLPNRRAFDAELSRRLAEWQRNGAPFCLVLIDIDHFKALNDRHGHPAGDEGLRNIAEVLEDTIREMDMVARVGGEEFAVILPSTNLVEGCMASERIRKAVAAYRFRFENVEMQLTVSLGVVAASSEDDATSLVKRADTALYTAKRSGRNCGFLHDGQTPERIDTSRRLTQAGRKPTDADDELVVLGCDVRSRLEALAGDKPQ